MPNICDKYALRIDFPVFLLLFSLQLVDSVFTNLILYSTCVNLLHYNETECALLGTKNHSSEITQLETEVQPHASVILMTKTFVEALFPAFLGFFLGPWSDVNGRKPLIILSFIGHILTFIIYVILSKIIHLSPWWFIVASIPTAISGGVCVVITAVYCYIGDVTEKDERPVRMSIFQTTVLLGLLVGQLISAPLLEATNYSIVFLTCVICLAIGLVFTVFIVPESVNFLERSETNLNTTPFEFLYNMFGACLRDRPNGARIILWCCIIILGILIFVMSGTSQVEYLFVRVKFSWTLERYTVYSSIQSIVHICGTMGGVYVLNNIFKIRETVIGMIALVSMIIVSLIKSFAFENWHLYATLPISILAGMILPIVRSIFSKTVSSQDLGKIFSLASSIEALTPLPAAPLYIFIYNSTILYFPGAFHLISLILYISDLIALIVIFQLHKKYSSLETTPLLTN